MADVKYPDYTPVDEPIPKGKVKAVEPGSDIKIEREPKDPESKSMGVAALKAAGATMGGLKTPVKKQAKGGMTASSRADGCCVKGKTRGKMM